MEYGFMAAATKRKASLTLNVEVLNAGKELATNVSVVAENAGLCEYRPDLSGFEPHKK